MEDIQRLDNEQFKQINDFDDYFVSNKGRVYSTKTHKFIGNKNKKTGYHTATLTRGKKSATKYIHHLVMRYFGKPKPNDDYEVDHIDGNKDNNSIENQRLNQASDYSPVHGYVTSLFLMYKPDFYL